MTGIGEFARKLRREFGRNYQAEITYRNALEEVYRLALEPYNPCHDRVREWIRRRQKQIEEEGI